MDATSAGEHPLELEKVRRPVRILVDLGRPAAEPFDATRFRVHSVATLARAVEIGDISEWREPPEQEQARIAAFEQDCTPLASPLSSTRIRAATALSITFNLPVFSAGSIR